MRDSVYFSPFRESSPARERAASPARASKVRYYAGHLLCERGGGCQVIEVLAMGSTFSTLANGAGHRADLIERRLRA